LSTTQQTHHHGGVVCHYSGMAVANQPALPPGASSEGIGQGWYSRVLFSLLMWPRKQLINKLYDFILNLIFISSQILSSPKQWKCTSPTVRTTRTSYLFPSTPFLHIFGWLLHIHF
jgi:hypothetical protein